MPSSPGANGRAAARTALGHTAVRRVQMAARSEIIGRGRSRGALDDLESSRDQPYAGRRASRMAEAHGRLGGWKAAPASARAMALQPDLLFWTRPPTKGFRASGLKTDGRRAFASVWEPRPYFLTRGHDMAEIDRIFPKVFRVEGIQQFWKRRSVLLAHPRTGGLGIACGASGWMRRGAKASTGSRKADGRSRQGSRELSRSGPGSVKAVTQIDSRHDGAANGGGGDTSQRSWRSNAVPTLESQRWRPDATGTARANGAGRQPAAPALCRWHTSGPRGACSAWHGTSPGARTARPLSNDAQRVGRTGTPPRDLQSGRSIRRLGQASPVRCGQLAGRLEPLRRQQGAS